jgi:hypothetical protein
LVYVRNDGIYFSGEFIGLYGNNNGIYFSGEFLGLYGNDDGIYSFQENSSVYMVTMMVYILFRRIPGFIW